MVHACKTRTSDYEPIQLGLFVACFVAFKPCDVLLENCSFQISAYLCVIVNLNKYLFT